MMMQLAIHARTQPTTHTHAPARVKERLEGAVTHADEELDAVLARPLRVGGVGDDAVRDAPGLKIIKGRDCGTQQLQSERYTFLLPPPACRGTIRLEQSIHVIKPAGSWAARASRARGVSSLELDS